MTTTKNNRKFERIMSLVFILGFVVWCASVLPLGPFSDDWYYKTSPNTYFTWSQLLPDGTAFWRPFDTLFGALLGLAPWLFPYLNHIVVVSGHILGGYLTYKLMYEHYGFGKVPTVLATLFFVFGVGNFAAVASIDSLNQVWSSTFGIAAFLFYVRMKDKKGMYNGVLFVLFCVFAVLSKENGIVWGFLIPVLYSLETLGTVKEIKESFLSALKSWLVIAFVVAAYFAARFLLVTGNLPDVSDDSYQVSIALLPVLKNIVTMVFGSLSSIDSIAIFAAPMNTTLATVTIVLNVPWMVMLLSTLLRTVNTRNKTLGTIVLMLCAVIAMLPNALTTTGEMHSYVFTFYAALFIAWVLDNAKNKDLVIAFVLTLCMYFLSSVMVSVHKWYMMDKCAKSSEVVLSQIEKAYEGKNPPQNVLVVCVADDDNSYSIYLQPVANGSYYGFASKTLWDWKYPQRLKAVYFKTLEEARQYTVRKKLNGEFDAEWLISSDGTFMVIDY